MSGRRVGARYGLTKRTMQHSIAPGTAPPVGTLLRGCAIPVQAAGRRNRRATSKPVTLSRLRTLTVTEIVTARWMPMYLNHFCLLERYV
jgi:hypothetical protein